MSVTTETQIVREAPELEAIKMNLLSEAARLAYRPEFGGQLPEYQVASFSPAQQAALQAGMDQGIGSYLPYIEAGNVALGQGLGATQVGQIAAAGAAGTYDPRSAAAFMNPYQQAVTEQSLQDIRRQADIAGQSQAAQAVRTGAFGGTREGVQRAEMERNVQNLMAQQIAQGYAQNYAQAQQAAMQAEEAARQRQLGIGQLFGQLGQQAGQLGVQQAALGQTAQQMQQGDISFLYGLGQSEQASRSGKLMQFVHRRCKECTLPINRQPSCLTFIRAHRRRKWQQHLQRSRRRAPSNRLQALRWVR
jgi:phage baseplate assembly protein W